ncbi:uncharacterized protein [Physcomitrium patens]|uniref:Uncharacterized protein n=1 Tax=Physcomitrium patens TaxID=3218 RepID=A0A2K1IYP6_PHYPA|nr:hypothetical protein PHYPA_024211 [Physcomitrium patens]
MTSTNVAVPQVPSWGLQLKLCAALLSNSGKLGAAWITVTQRQGLGEAELNALTEMASADRRALTRFLESLSDESSEPKSNVWRVNAELVTILLRRLKAGEAMSAKSSPQSSGDMKGTDGRHL